MVSALAKLLRDKSTDGGFSSHGGTVEMKMRWKRWKCLSVWNQLRINPFWHGDREGGFGSDVCQRVSWTARRRRSFELGYSNLSISWASIVMQALSFEVPWASRLLPHASLWLAMFEMHPSTVTTDTVYWGNPWKETVEQRVCHVLCQNSSFDDRSFVTTGPCTWHKLLFSRHDTRL